MVLFVIGQTVKAAMLMVLAVDLTVSDAAVGAIHRTSHYCPVLIEIALFNKC